MTFVEYVDTVLEELEKLEFPKMVTMVINEGHMTEAAAALVMGQVQRNSYASNFTPKECASILNEALKIVVIEKAGEETKQ